MNEIKNQKHISLILKDEKTFLYRRIYSPYWMEIPREQVETVFNNTFPGQEFELTKAAIALNLHFQNQHNTENTPAKPH